MRIVAAICALAAFITYGAEPLVLAERNKPPSYKIVVREGASACERYAAEELRDFLKRQTGVELSVINDAQELPGKAIVIGNTKFTDGMLNDCKLSDDAFRIKACGERLFVNGGEGRGALYGVYELLERFGGCAWYSLRFQVVPEIEKFSVPGDIDEKQSPSFDSRTENWNGFGKELEFAARNKLNLDSFPEKLGGSKFRFDEVLGSCHTFERLVPVAKWFDSHPEYFSEKNGVRIKNSTQLCLTNPDVLKLCIEGVMKRIEVSYPKGVRYFGVSPNDWANGCECEKCREIDKRAKSKAGSLLEFVNKIADAVAEKYPDVFIQTLAYGYTRRPPVGIKARRNVQVCLCTIECDFSKSITDSRYRENRRVRHDFSRWSQIAGSLSVWDYGINFACYNHVWPNYAAMQGNLKFFRDMGVKEVFTLNNGGGPNDVWSNIRCWLLAKWMWNCDADMQGLLGKCFKDYFGPAAGDVQKYFDLVCAMPRDTKRFPMSCFSNVYAAGIDESELVKASKILEVAASKVAGTKWEENLRLARVPVDFTLSVRGAARPRLSMKPQDLERRRMDRDAARRLVALMDAPGSIYVCDDLAGRTVFTSRLRELAVRETPQQQTSRRLLLEENHLTGDYPSTTFKYVDDPAAKNGKAIMLQGKMSACTASLNLDSLDLDKDCDYMFRIRVRTNGARGARCQLRAGIYNRTRDRASHYFEPSQADAELGMESYRWFTVGIAKPKAGDSLLVALADRNDANVPVPDVYIDCVEIVSLQTEN